MLLKRKHNEEYMLLTVVCEMSKSSEAKEVERVSVAEVK
jgi:hypothetical protein